MKESQKLLESLQKNLKEGKQYYGIDFNGEDGFGSGTNSQAFDLLSSLAEYFTDYAEVVDDNPYEYQLEDSAKLEYFAQKIAKIRDELDDYWTTQMG